MAQPRRPGPEPGFRELLSEEIVHLLMRADGVERHEVEALVMRLSAWQEVDARGISEEEVRP